MGPMAMHTHDDVDWASRVSAMRRFDALQRDWLNEVARSAVNELPTNPTIVDVGSGAGGMSAAFANCLRQRSGATIVLVDAVAQLLSAAQNTVAVPGDRSGDQAVHVQPVVADMAGPDLAGHVPAADLLWASGVVHHAPDQQAALDGLVRTIRPGGWIALAEGGLEPQSLPWDLGVGEPGLERRLQAARDCWFRDMRAAMDGVVRMPYGWTEALRRSGLTDVRSVSYLNEHPPPLSEDGTAVVIDRIAWLSEVAADRVDERDQAALRQLLDPDAPEYLGARDDLHLLDVRTIHYGRKL